MENINSKIYKISKKMFKHKTIIIIVIVCILFIPSFAYGKTTSIEFERYGYATITYPVTVVLGDKFTVSFVVKNTSSSAEKENIVITIDGQKSFIPVDKNRINIQRLAPDGYYGETFDFIVPNNATQGKQFFNLNFTSGKDSPIFYNTIIPITITDQPQLVIRTITPDSIFTDAEFPFVVEIEGQGTNIRDVTVQIIPPEEIIFRGEKQHTFSSIPKNTPISIRAQLVTLGQGDVDYEQFIPFTIIVQYTDDAGKEKEESKTVSLLLRPRTHFEWGSNAGLWIGDVYLAPTISIGTIVGIPAGAIFSLLFRRWWKKRG